MRSAWIVRLALLAIVVVTSTFARQHLDAMSSSSKVLAEPQLPAFLALHAAGMIAFAILFWLGIPNDRGRKWLGRANLVLKVFAVPLIAILVFVQWRFWTAIF